MSEKDKMNNFKGKCPKKILLDLQISVFENPAEIFPTRYRSKSITCPKRMEKCMFWKTLFFCKVFLWTRRMQFQQTGQEKRRGQKLLLSVWKWLKTSFVFQKFFWTKFSIDKKNAVLRGQLNFSRWITAKHPKKDHKKCKSFSKLFSSNCSHGEVGRSLKAPLTFFGQPAETFPLDFQKITICNFSKRFSPGNFHWNWESSFDISDTFFENRSKILLSVQKWKKFRRRTVLL